jgi:hypothetical protein
VSVTVKIKIENRKIYKITCKKRAGPQDAVLNAKRIQSTKSGITRKKSFVPTPGMLHGEVILFFVCLLLFSDEESQLILPMSGQI